MEDVARTVKLAGSNGKYALIVLGANWCHDSRALAARLHKPPLRGLIQSRYETVLIDVGYYEHGIDVLERFGHPAYYATPTVLIVDPESGALVDDTKRHQWGNAYNISMDDSVAYFMEMATATPSEQSPVSDDLELLYEEIRQWERQMADRVLATYGEFGPLLRQYKRGDVPPDFRRRWDEFSRFRNAIPPSVQDLRAQAKEAVAAEATFSELDYPEFPPFSWEGPADP